MRLTGQPASPGDSDGARGTLQPAARAAPPRAAPARAAGSRAAPGQHGAAVRAALQGGGAGSRRPREVRRCAPPASGTAEVV